MPEAAHDRLSLVESVDVRLKRWMTRTALPFWSTKGINPLTGLSFERFNADGTPDYAAPQRVRVQFRQVFVLSYAQELGWFPRGGEMAARLWDKTMDTFWRNDEEGFIHILASDGSILDERCDSYDHAFAMLALAWLARATGEQRYYNQIDRLLAFVDEHLTDAQGYLLEGMPHHLPRRQNPQMHWFEAMLALHEAIGHPEGLRRAAHFRTFFERRLLDPATGTLGEFFSEDWGPAPGAPGTIVEPGHMVEWTWLLRVHERLARLPHTPLATSLLHKALQSADPVSGLLVDEADRQHRVRRGQRRSWLQTELCKAWIAEAEIGRAGASEKALQALAVLEERYLCKPFEAGWIDQLDAASASIPGEVPASTLYHVIVALAEADRVLGGRKMMSVRQNWPDHAMEHLGAAE